MSGYKYLHRRTLLANGSSHILCGLDSPAARGDKHSRAHNLRHPVAQTIKSGDTGGSRGLLSHAQDQFQQETH